MALDNNTAVNYTDKNTIKNWFKTGLKPTQKQFWSTGDSFWHKSESLPISSISGLGNLLDGKAEENHEHNQYAKNDATSLTADNITAWQRKLGVADLKFDDKAITTTQDYAEFGLDSGATINAFNNAIYTEVAKKLDAPTENATDEYVLLADGSTAAKGDLGKNFSNTDLEVSENRKHTGTASVELAIPMIYSNASQRFSGLVDKSADATYNVFPVLDNNGNLAKASKAFFAFKNFLNQNSIAENLELGQLLNGGQGSGRAISVASIMPRLFPIENNNTTIILNGAGLSLNVTDFRLDILTEEGVILSRVPNAHITFVNDNQLKFYYNFYALGVGKFKLKITSGVKVYITSVSYQVVNNVEYIETSTITWERLFATDYVERSKTVAVGATVTHENELKTIASSSVKCALKSSQLFAQGEDFLIELDFNVSQFTGIAYDNLATMLQLCYSSTQNSLANYGVAKLFWGTFNSYSNFQTLPIAVFLNNVSVSNNVDRDKVPPYSNIITIVKQGNEITLSCGSKSYYTTIQNNSGYALSVQIPYRRTDETFSINVLKAYKIIN